MALPVDCNNFVLVHNRNCINNCHRYKCPGHQLPVLRLLNAHTHSVLSAVKSHQLHRSSRWAHGRLSIACTVKYEIKLRYSLNNYNSLPLWWCYVVNSATLSFREDWVIFIINFIASPGIPPWGESISVISFDFLITAIWRNYTTHDQFLLYYQYKSCVLILRNWLAE